MTNKDIHKFYKFLKEFPEHHSLMKNFLIDYLAIKEQNQKLVEQNLKLIDEVYAYEMLQKQEQELVIH